MVKERILRVLILFVVSSFKNDCFAQISAADTSMTSTSIISETVTMPASSTPLDPSSTIALSTLPASTVISASPTTQQPSEAATTLKPQEASTASSQPPSTRPNTTSSTLLATNSTSSSTTITPLTSTSSPAPSTTTTKPLNTTSSPLPSTTTTKPLNTTTSPLPSTTTIKPLNTTSIPTGSPTSVAETATGSSSTINATTTTIPTTIATNNCSCKGINEECSNATCICLNGYVRLSANESCTLMASPIPSQNESTTETSTIFLSSTTQITTQEPEEELKQQERVRSALNLTANEKMDVVSIGLDPASSALDWIFKKETTFRTVVASIFSKYANFTVISDDVVFVAPSPLLTNAEGLLVSFLIRDALGDSPPRDPVSGGAGTESIIARHQRRESTKRNLAKTTENPAQKEAKSGYFLSEWIVTALKKGEKTMEEALNQSVVALYGGGIPSELLNSLPESLKGPCASASSTLFERRLDVFIPIIMVGGLCIIGLIIGIIVIRSRKRRSSQKWDPQPASVTFCKATLRREDTVVPGDLGSVTNRATGHPLPAVGGRHLASDDQCRDGEVKLVFNNSQHLNRQNHDADNDDDAWVVPFDDGQEHGGTTSSNNKLLKSQFEDTKL